MDKSLLLNAYFNDRTAPVFIIVSPTTGWMIWLKYMRLHLFDLIAMPVIM
jgi:hypothetical protein